MTAERQDGTPAPRRRASQRRGGGLRAAATGTAARPAAQPAEMPAEVEPAPAPKPQPAPAVRTTTKYTALLDDPTAVAFDELALIARRKLGRRVDKSQLMRALILLAADDASLRDQVIDQIGRAEQHPTTRHSATDPATPRSS